MNKQLLLILAFFMLVAGLFSCHTNKNKEKNQPNIIYILADDLAGQYPETVKQMKMIMEKEHMPGTVEKFKLEAIGDTLTN